MPDAARGRPAPPDRDVYTVGRLNREAKLLLEQGFPPVWIDAEISNFSRPSSGHWYFSLKDRDAQIRCAMFRQRNMAVRFVPKEGTRVLARGRVSLYEPRGDFQLIVEHLEEAGFGALQREFERLKEKLAAEGLFAQALKREPPVAPGCVGVVTSPTGAALRDILNVLRRRCPAARVVIYPTQVQGAAAVPGVLAALESAALRRECDVLLIARGGGSIEDLWAFNDERIARAIRAHPVPVITGIGHEVDFTIADFVADVRAPTPSAAAELAVPDARAWAVGFAQATARLEQALRQRLRRAGESLRLIERRLALVHPGARIARDAQRLDDLERRAVNAMRVRLAQSQARLAASGARLHRASPAMRVRNLIHREAQLAQRLASAMAQRLVAASARLAVAQARLDAVSPLATLARGFAVLVRERDGRLVTDAGQLEPGETFEARLRSGRIGARVTRIDREREP